MRAPYKLAWACFLAAVALVFSAIEIPAIADPRAGDTLSEFVRSAIVAWPPLAAIFAAALIWFLVHILWRP